MKRIQQTDFSGGLFEFGDQPGDFTERQVLQAFGLVYESPSELRTQWAWSDSHDHASKNIVRGIEYIGPSGDVYVVAVASDNTVWYKRVSASGSWTELASLTTTNAAFPTAVVPWIVSGEVKPAVLLSSLPGASRAAHVVYESSSGTLTGVTDTDYYPALSGDTPVSGKIPIHRAACMWGSVAVLGGIEWSRANPTTLGSGNVQSYANYVWLSESDPADTSAFDPRYPVRVADEGSVITALVPTDEGVVVCTSKGIWMLRGTPSNYRVDKLLGNCNVLAAAWWDFTQAVVAATADGRVLMVRPSQVTDLSDNSIVPEAATSASVTAYGPHLFWHRNGRLFCLAAFEGGEGAWSELRPRWHATVANDTNYTLSRIFEANGLLFYVSTGGQLNHFSFARGNAGLRDTTGPSVLTCRVFGDPSGGVELVWDKVAVSVSRGNNSGFGTAPVVTDVVCRDTVPLNATADGPSLPTSVPSGTSTVVVFDTDETISGRETVVVPGYGPSPQLVVSVFVTGDVRFHAVTAFYTDGQDEW